MKSKTATLTAGLVKKGEAAPATPTTGSASAASPPPTTAPAAPGTGYYKALTVKLDKDRYLSLKTAGVRLDKKSQEIFTEALDLWLKTNN